MTKPVYTTAPMMAQLGPGDTKVSPVTLDGKADKTKDARIAALEGHRRQWRSRAFGLADALRELANNPANPDSVRKFAANALAAAELDGVER